jgi:hypothetical protein
MLEIKLERVLEPEQMREQPCGVCGRDFHPKAVVALLYTDHYLPAVCEECLTHLAQRAEVAGIPANWNIVYANYLSAVAKYPEPVFATREALLEAEQQDPHWNRIHEMSEV